MDDDEVKVITINGEMYVELPDGLYVHFKVMPYPGGVTVSYGVPLRLDEIQGHSLLELAEQRGNLLVAAWEKDQRRG